MRRRHSCAGRALRTGASGRTRPSSNASATTRIPRRARRASERRARGGVRRRGRLRDVLVDGLRSSFGRRRRTSGILEDGFQVGVRLAPAELRRSENVVRWCPVAAGRRASATRSGSRRASRRARVLQLRAVDETASQPAGSWAASGAACTESPRRAHSRSRRGSAAWCRCRHRLGSHVWNLWIASERRARRRSACRHGAASLVDRGPDSRRVPHGPSHSRRAGSRSSTSPAVTSRSRRHGACIVVRTAICNYPELRRERARGTSSERAATPRCTCTSTSSTGASRPRSRGMFAVALWDAERRRSCSHATATGSSRSTTATPVARSVASEAAGAAAR